VNHWAREPMVTRDVDIVVAIESVEKAVQLLQDEGFAVTKFPWSVNFQGRSKVSIQLSTEDFYREFPARAVPADVHGILLRVASLADTLAGKIMAWSDPERRQSKRVKDLGDIIRLVEAHSELWETLPEKLKGQVEKPNSP